MIGKVNWIVEGDFTRLLHIPTSQSGSVLLQPKESVSEILKGIQSVTLSYGENMLGPTIRATHGEEVLVQLQNWLNEETNIHWHGLIFPENMDGHPKDIVIPGESFQYRLPVLQRAGTYWYHPHPHGDTAKQVFHGLAGLFIVADEEENSLNLPSGIQELPLILQDKHFVNGQLDYSLSEEEVMSGYLGEYVLVNGIHGPVAHVASGWNRLRIVNGSTARVFNLGLSGGIPFFIIGADGGLLPTPVKVSVCMLGPGERLDILVDLTSFDIGQEFYLVSNRFSEFNVQGRQSFRMMKFLVNHSPEMNFSLPATLSHIAPIDPGSTIATRRFDISAMNGGGAGHDGGNRHTINGRPFEMDRVDEVVRSGSTEIWEFDNQKGDEIHPMHIHGVQFQVLNRMGGRNQLIESEKGWKDTVLVMPGEKVSVIMTFPLYTGVFVMHCHNLEHEDDGMMMNFRII